MRACRGRAVGLPSECARSPWFASTAVRARETAAIAGRALASAIASEGEGAVTLPCEAATLSSEIVELDMGDFAGRLRSDVYSADVRATIAANPWDFKPPNGESQHEVEVRVRSFVEREVLPVAVPGGPPTVVVAHGLAIKCFLRHVLGSDAAMTWKVRLDNCSITEVGFEEDVTARDAGWHVLRVNDTAHLREL